MYDEAKASRLARAPGADVIESMSEDAERRRPRRWADIASIPGHEVRQAGVLDGVAKRLVIFAEQDVATTQMVALTHRGNPRMATYLASDMRNLNGRPWWPVRADAQPLTLEALGVRIVLSGRTNGGVVFRIKQVLEKLPRFKTADGRRVYWRGRENEWLRLHWSLEPELVQ